MDFEIVGVYTYDADSIVIAHYEANEYTIAYVSDNNTIYSQSVTYGQPYKLYNPNDKENYEFCCWRDAMVDGAQLSDGIFEFDYNIVLYATWTKILTISLETGCSYTVDKTVQKVYVIGNYTGLPDSIMSDIGITISMRDSDLTLCLINAGFKGRENCAAIDCENSSYTLMVLLSGDSYIEGGKGSDGINGKSGSKMTASNCNGTDGQNGGCALNCGTVIFENKEKNSSLHLVGGSGGNGGNGGVDKDRSRMWLNYCPNGGSSGNSASALHCVAYSINGTTVTFEKGEAGEAGKAGSRGDWWCSACYGSDGKKGKQLDVVSYK